jgi:hypothetical protein
VQGGGGIEPAGEGDADFLADRQGFENYGHWWNLVRLIKLVKYSLYGTF